NLEQKVRAASRPAHLLTFIHPAVHQEVGCPFGDRGPNSQPGTMPLGVIHQPGALAGQIAIQRPQGRPKLSRWRDGFPAVRLAPEIIHALTNTIDAFPRVLRFPIPDPPVQSLNLRDDHGLRRRACRITCLQPVRDLFEVLVSGAKPRAACIFPLPPTRAGTIRLVHVTARRSAWPASPRVGSARGGAVWRGGRAEAAGGGATRRDRTTEGPQ